MEELINTIKTRYSIERPTAMKHLPKELTKVRQATQFIGEGAPNSTANLFKEIYESYNLANTGNYSKEDIIFLSSNGKRRGAIVPICNGQLYGAYKNIDLAIAEGASFIADTQTHLERTGNYNIGECLLAEYLATRGYQRVGNSGLWKLGLK